jgi:aminoglycoside phosphotransferase family enzyme/cytidylate kinase
MPAAEDEELEVAAFMADPTSYPGHAAARVDVIETHAARVFLAGEDAYKVKKRVRLPFLDFSTLEARHRALARELEINRPHAPSLYLELKPIVRGADGRLALGGEGELVDWALHMRRFPQEALLVRVAEKGPLSDTLSRALADVAVRYHRASPIAAAADGAGVIEPVVRQLAEAIGGAQGLIGAKVASAFADRLEQAFARSAPLLKERGRAGSVRRCHGDLHLGNIVLIDGAPVPFDALEFSERLGTIDVLYDLAFLLMDLDYRGDRHAANVVLNAYVSAEPVGSEIEGLRCLPLFLAARAGVRAAVAVERMAQTEGAAQEEQRESIVRHAQLALSYLEPPPPLLIAIGGLSGTGKSTLAAALAALIGPAPGALHVRSDVERKRLFGVPETQRLERQHYRIAVAQRVYSILEDKARRALAAGQAAIVDAVFAKPEEREAIEAIARASGCAFLGLWLTAPAEVLVERVERRIGDASDADRRVVKEQLRYELGGITWTSIDASGSPSQSLDNAKAALRSAGLSLEERALPRP